MVDLDDQVIDDALLSPQEQGVLHHHLFEQLFFISNNSVRINSRATRLRALIERCVPLLNPQTFVDITKSSMYSFLTVTWPDKSVPAISSALRAYIRVGTFDIHKEHVVDIQWDQTRANPGTALQQAIQKGDPNLVEVLIEMGSNLNKVPSRFTLVPRMGAPFTEPLVEVSKGDYVAFAEAHQGPGSEVALMVRAAAMRQVVASARASSVTADPTSALMPLASASRRRASI